MVMREDYPYIHYEYYFIPHKKERLRLIHIVLFVLTFITTTFFGSLMEGGDPLTLSGFLMGIPYSLSLMTVLLLHEMGHFIMSRYYGVSVSYPYFIPAPNFIGTFGAFIKMKSPIPTKRALFDIGFAGPFAGFVASLVAVYIGLEWSKVIPVKEVPEGSIRLGSCIAFDVMVKVVKGNIPEGYELYLGPVAFAGWLGLFVTAMNLIPIGQTDGGHILYAVVGRYHGIFAFLFIVGLLILGVLKWPGWLFWALIITLIGIWHPPVINPIVPLDRKRKLLGLFVIIIFVLSFTPVPFSM